MNIFVLSECPIEAAQFQCNAHVVKMILESAQMLSTAHRILDGELSIIEKNGRKCKVYTLNDERDGQMYKATHINHPCSIGCRESTSNYDWLYNHFLMLCEEYQYRYNKIHKTDSLLGEILATHPDNLPEHGMTRFALAMPDEFKMDNVVESYRLYYSSKIKDFKMVWKNSGPPEWFRMLTLLDQDYNIT